MDPLFERQEYLEGVSVEQAIQKYKKEVANTPLSEVGAGLVLLKECMEPMCAALEKYFEPSKGNPQYHRTKEVLKCSTKETLSFITLKAVINSLATTGSSTLQNTCVQLAGMVKENQDYEQFKADHPGYLYRVEENLRTSTLHHKRKVITRARRMLGSGMKGWGTVSKFHVGRTLIDLLIKSTGLVEAKLTRRRNKDMYVLVPTTQTLQYLERAHAKCSELHPQYLPMVMRPRDWTTPFDGGLLSTEATHRHTLLKTHRFKELFDLANHDMPDVYSAINTLQRTKWRINRRVLDVMEELWKSGANVAGLPARDEEPLPPKPWEPFGTPTEQQKKAWKRKATAVYDRRVRERSKRVAAGFKVRIANEVKDDPAIYFCYTMDWRGRVYPLQNFVNPQADDSGRAVLEFAEGKPLGEDGAFWLAVHGANCYGVDKVGFAERVRWIEQHRDHIVQSAAHPLDYRWWAEADDPFQFLAFCFEWAGVPDVDAHTYESRLPVGMDGSCNGLQNFSGLLLDPVGAQATNLAPSEEPADIYQQVADVLNRKVEQDAAAGVVEARMWRGKITRKITKRGVMTTPYGAKLYGLRDQLKTEMNKLSDNYLGVEDPKDAIKYLSGKLYEAIGEVVVAARLAMEWLQKDVARTCSKNSTPIRWTTPVGFRPVQDYRKQDLIRVDTIWGSLRFQLGLRVDTEKMDKRKQEQGISPNYVHSLDAAHMMMTVNECRELGIESFSMIHDSYATHAADVHTMNQVLREVFISIYREDQLGKFYEEVLGQLDTAIAREIPPPPARGSFNIEVVRDSKYFFG